MKMSFRRLPQVVFSAAVAFSIISPGLLLEARAKEQESKPSKKTLISAKNKSEGSASKKGTAQTKSEKSSQNQDSEEFLLRAQMAVLTKALSAGDAKVIADLWAEDGIYTASDGSQFSGRQSIEKRFAGLLSSGPRPALELVPDSVKLISSGVALAQGEVRRLNGVNGPEAETRFLLVFKKSDGNWLINSAVETPILASANEEPLSDLAFLIGEWSAQNGEASVNMKAEWAANKKFINCKFELKKSAAGAPLESRQVIAWDPRNDQPISWHFDSDGGFGFGSWKKQDKRWVIDSSNVERDGSVGAASNVIAINDPDNFVWQSLNRSLNGVPVNDTAPLKVHRLNK